MDSEHVSGNVSDRLVKIYIYIYILGHEPAAFKAPRHLSITLRTGMKNIYLLSKNRTAGIHRLITVKPGVPHTSPTILHFCSMLKLPSPEINQWWHKSPVFILLSTAGWLYSYHFSLCIHNIVLTITIIIKIRNEYYTYDNIINNPG